MKIKSCSEMLDHVWKTKGKPQNGLTSVKCIRCGLKARLKGNPYNVDLKSKFGRKKKTIKGVKK